MVTLDASVGVRSSYKALDMMDSGQFYNFITTAYANEQTFDKTKFTNQYRKGYDTDWWKETTRSALNQNYNLSVRTGTEKSRTALSLGYVDEQGIILTTSFKRISARLNQEYDLNRYITVGATVNIASMNKRDASSLPAFDFIQKADPFTPVISPLVDPSSENYKYDKYAPTEWSFDPNPVSILNLNDRKHEMFNVFGNVFAQVNFTKDLHYRFQLSFERYNDTYKAFLPIYSATFSDDMMGNRESKYNTETKMTHNTSWVKNYLAEQRINYAHDFGKHRLDVMAAMTYEKNNSEGINAYKHTALGNAEIYRIMGEIAYAEQDYARTVEMLKRYESMSAQVLRNDMYLLGLSYYQTGDYPDAITYLSKVTAKQDEMAENAYLHIGNSYVKLGDKANARTTSPSTTGPGTTRGNTSLLPLQRKHSESSEKRVFLTWLPHVQERNATL